MRSKKGFIKYGDMLFWKKAFESGAINEQKFKKFITKAFGG